MDPVSIAFALATRYAPEALRWLTGSDKAAEAAAAVVGVAQAITGKGEGVAALQALQASPELRLQFRRELLNRQAELDLAYLGDRKDARARDVALAQTGVRNRRPDVLVGLAFAGCVLIGLLLAFGGVDAASATGGYLIAVGTLFAQKIGTAFDFEFGSSRSSQDKDVTIKQLSEGP